MLRRNPAAHQGFASVLDVAPGKQRQLLPCADGHWPVGLQARLRETPLVKRNGRAGMSQQSLQLLQLVLNQLFRRPPLRLVELIKQ